MPSSRSKRSAAARAAREAADESPPPKPSAQRHYGRSPGHRPRKKQKRLDALFDKKSVSPSIENREPPAGAGAGAEDPSLLRRSSRARRAPDVLDSSPVPASRGKKPKPSDSPKKKTKEKVSIEEDRGFGKKNESPLTSPQKEPASSHAEEEEGGWRSRLRSRVGKGRRKLSSRVLREEEGLGSKKGRRRKRGSTEEVPMAVEEIKNQNPILISSEKDDSGGDNDNDNVEEPEEAKIGTDPGSSEPEELETSVQIGEVRDEVKDETNQESQKVENGNALAAHSGEYLNSIAVETEKTSKANDLPVEKEKTAKVNDMEPPLSDDKLSKSQLKEGRRCGLCGGGVDGKPPKKLIRESVESDREAYEGSSASEEPDYNAWDGFGDEPGWLGRLLGPIHDRFGIARVWVHQHCAVWSPEVYFAGLGCLKNVRAALCRGRALKCSRCGRPGATIGCRVDRCPKTYHLPCSRADGCIFDHRKFLIACNDHRHLFQPQGIDYSHQIRKRKAKKLKLGIRKLSNDAWRKDLEAEEKWLENCGEDEEFLKREGRRLHRDILRIAPTYIGGSSENGKLYQGWESVAGLQDVIRCMKEVVILPLLYPDLFSNLGLTPPRGVLLHGYPGTGKTLVVRALIGACSRGDKRIAYFARKGADCLGKYVGDAERQLRLLFQVAEKCQPSIIFFDEIDGLAPCRSRHQDQTHSSVVSTLLSLLDGLKSRGSVIVVGATNRPEAVDPALRRPGRFDREIYFPLPSEKDRSAILSLRTQSWPNPLSGAVLSHIANQTVGYAGADLEALCTQAAMNALKRNCSLQEILSSAEKGTVHGRLPSLPALVVEERDWLAALALAPPPCSRREAGMAVNDVVSSPLPTHITPCILQELSHLLISLYNDERIWLPPVLYKASKYIKSIIISALEQKRVPIAFWRSHLHHLIKEPYIANEIEENLFRCGLVSGQSVVDHSCTSDDHKDDHEMLDSFRSKQFGENVPSNLKHFHRRWGNSSGFRALISGTPRSGQQHLASCLLHGFMGHIEIQKVNLATISQEGHGDILRGLTQILSRCLSVGRNIIYMPRIDLWAIDETIGQDVEESQINSYNCKSPPRLQIHAGTKCVSDIWNSFVEQVDSTCTSTLIILATCEVQNDELPLEIRKFFSGDLWNHGGSAPSENTMPRFFVNLVGTFNHELVINLCAAKLSHDLVQHYVQLVHHRTHTTKSQDKIKVSNAFEVTSDAPMQGIVNRGTTAVLDTSANSERIASHSRASSTNDQFQQGIKSDPLSHMQGHQQAGAHRMSHPDSLTRILPSKTTKGNSTLAIATFGYQILRYPQFAELCWVTSKLREGPCTGVNGPWKGWPFNACVMRDCSSPDKVVVGVNGSNPKDKEHSGVVRGLIAVGLLAYRGVYTSVREVAVEVRKVSELLVGHIRTKILGRKDRYLYLRILSQVAYIEDMINNWAYTFQSSQIDDQALESNTNTVSTGGVSADNIVQGSDLLGNPSRMPSVNTRSCDEEKEGLHKECSEKSVTTNGQCVNFSQCVNFHAGTPPQAEHFHEGVSSAAPPSILHSRPSTSTTFVSGDENIPTFENPNSSVNLTKSSSKEVNTGWNLLESVLSSNGAQVIPDNPCNVADFNLRKNSNSLPASEKPCLYECCSGCLQVIYSLVRDILYQCWESDGRCSTLDDIHNIISSCSSNLLAAFRKCYISESTTNLVECSDGTPSGHCACQEVGEKLLKDMSRQRRSSKRMQFLPAECSCHLRNDEDNATIHTESNSAFCRVPKFLCRDGVLIPLGTHKVDVLHCRYGKLCLCSIVETVLSTKQPYLCDKVG